jgi:hypothetical protein
MRLNRYLLVRSAVVIAIAGASCRPYNTGDHSDQTRTGRLKDLPRANGVFLDNYLESIKNNDLFKPNDLDDFAQLATVKYPCAACPGDSAAFLVIPVKDAQNIGWAPALVGNTNDRAEVIAAMIQLDAMPVAELDIEAGDAIFVWMGYVAPNARGIGIYSFNRRKKTKKWIEGEKIFWVCKDPGIPRNKPSVKVNPKHDCSHTPMQTADGDPLPPPINQTRTMALGGLWLSCGGGCCKPSPTRSVSSAVTLPASKLQPMVR